MSERSPSTGRTVAFAVLVTTGVLWGVNAAVDALEERGVVETHDPDDRVQFLDSELFEVEDPGPQYVSTAYGKDFMVPQRFPVDRSGRWRMFWTGGSFAMGSPYVFQGHGAEFPGGMTWWLRNELHRRWPGVGVDLVNLAAGGQNSHRVRRTVEQSTPLGPDLWFVATCNNEGALPPHLLLEELHGLSGYRMLRKYLLPRPERAARSYYTPQDPDTKKLAQAFRANIRAIIKTAHEASVPLLLATLPINLRWEGRNSDQPILLDQGGEAEQKPCIRDAVARYRKTDYQGVLDILETCDDVVERLQWSGLALLQLNRFDEGVAALEQSVELVPRNRCRPSFNTIIREEAARDDNVTLVDLDKAARDPATAGAVGGAPGPELFLDYCHMTYDGYRKMADVVLKTMREAGLTPPGDPTPVEPLDPDVAARRAGLTRIRFVDD